MRVGAGRSILIGLLAAVCACVAIFVASFAWGPSGGRVAPALVAPFLLVLARPLLERLVMRLAGEERARSDAPRVLWTSLALLSPVTFFGEYDGFWRSFTHGPWLRFGYVGLDSIDRVLGWGFVIGGPVAGIVAHVVARAMDAWPAKAMGKAGRAIAIVLCLLPVPMAVQRAMIAPTAAQYEASLEVVGAIPPIALPSGPEPAPRNNPKSYEAYPYTVPAPDVGPFHVVRFCSPTFCTVCISREKFPERYDDDRMPRKQWHLYDSGEGFELRRDPVAQLLFSRRLHDGQHDWVTEPDLASIYDHEYLARTIAPPLPILVAPIVGALLAVLLLRRARSRRAPDEGWKDARLEPDGLCHFDDGTAPARPPANPAKYEGPVLVLLEAGSTSTFRDAGAATITRLFPGTRDDLAKIDEQRQGAERAFALAIAILFATPLVAAAFSGLC